jgi:hypothetical protein
MTIELNFFHAYRITSDGSGGDEPTLRLRWGDGDQAQFGYLPIVDGVRFVFLSRRRSQRLALSGAAVSIERLDLGASLWMRLGGGWIKKKYVLDYRDLRIFIGGPKAFRRVLVSAIRYLRKLGTPLEGPEIERHPELVLGWGPDGVALPERSGPPRETSARVAVVLHIFYADLWPEFRAVLMGLPLAFDLIVTTVADREALIATIRADFPEATIRVVENRGRDVRPFLVLLEEGELDAYDCVCKIHDKKSLHGLNRNPFGDVWRRRLLFDLLCAEGTMARAVERFERNLSLGLLGPEVFRIAGAETADFSWKKNRSLVSQLSIRLGRAPDQILPDFFAGAMFWVRPKALAPLRALRLSEEFEAEQGKMDGALEHALERIFSSVVKIAGYDIEEINGLRL